MKKETLLLVGVAFLAGLLVGIIGANIGKDSGQPVSQIVSSNASVPVVDQQQQISKLQKIVTAEPNNRNAWVQLGHKYFDSEQPMEAIDAYAKALEIDGNDPDVLTDQGVMFRQVGWYDRAIANFDKAVSQNSNHQQSLYNLGIVYRYDLQDFEKAIDAWSRFVALNPDGSAADQIRADLEFMTTHLDSHQPPEQSAQPK